MLQKKLSTGEDSVSVVSKDYEEVVKGTLSQVTPRESFEFYKNSEPPRLKTKENSSSQLGEEKEINNDQEEDEDEDYSQETDKFCLILSFASLIKFV